MNTILFLSVVAFLGLAIANAKDCNQCPTTIDFTNVPKEKEALAKFCKNVKTFVDCMTGCSNPSAVQEGFKKTAQGLMSGDCKDVDSGVATTSATFALTVVSLAIVTLLI